MFANIHGKAVLERSSSGASCKRRIRVRQRRGMNLFIGIVRDEVLA